MKVLLFGGAGYIGGHVALSFIDKSHTVGIFDNFSTGSRENIHKGSIVYEGDILHESEIDGVLKEGWDGVVHLAAFKGAGESMILPEKYSVNNISGSLNIISRCSCAGIKNIVLSSSAAVYGNPVYLPVDENHPVKPENYYGFTKLEIERNLGWYDRLKQIKYASLRYFNAAGYDIEGRVSELEINPANLIPVVMEAAAGKRDLVEIFGDDYPTRDGTGVRDYIHVTDLAEAHVQAFEYIAGKGESITVNLGSGKGYSVREVIETAERITGKTIPSVISPRRAGDPAELVASSAAAEKILGWKSRFSDLDTLLDSTWRIYCSNYGR